MAATSFQQVTAMLVELNPQIFKKEVFCIFNCQIPYTVKVGDANSYGMSVMELEQANPASLAYLELAKEVLANA